MTPEFLRSYGVLAGEGRAFAGDGPRAFTKKNCAFLRASIKKEFARVVDSAIALGQIGSSNARHHLTLVNVDLKA